MTKLTTDNYWVGFNTATDSDETFSQFLGLITSLEGSSENDQWVKWKNFAHQVVIQTPKYFYKLYEEYTYEGFLNCKIREILADIYKEYGVFWNITTINKGDKIYQIEQREKLELCSEDIISFEDLLLNWNQTLLKIEEKLKLNKVVLQLPQELQYLNLKLVRDCVNKYEDYAIKGDKVILLDDADWFLALVTKEGSWVPSEWKPHDVATIFGPNFTFAPLDYKSRYYQHMADIVYKLNTPNKKWMLFPINDISIASVCDKLVEKKEQLLETTIKVLGTNKALPKSEPLLLTDKNT